ncbi:hypothetical protein HYU06_04335 [Candidatus Woesearchaeota archaeon]|nr:hypothetical protein [Candidatus Woesearchaeota archaeon]
MKINNKKIHSRHQFTKQLPDALYGQLDEIHSLIEINIEYIWRISNDEDKFIDEFSKTYAHELIHLLMANIMHDIFEIGEEKVIRKLLHEEWDKELETYYEERGKK